MKISDINSFIEESLKDEVRNTILNEQLEGSDDTMDKSESFNIIKSFTSLSGLSNNISNIKDIGGDGFGVEIDIQNISEDEFINACGASSLEDAQSKLTANIHSDLEQRHIGENCDVDVHVDGAEQGLNVKIKIVANNEKLGSDMNENIEQPMEGNAFVAALNKAKENGDDTFEVDGETHNVEECWKQMEEQEGIGEESDPTQIPMDEMKKMKNPCWDGYKAYGTKTKNGKEVPNCVPIDEAEGMGNCEECSGPMNENEEFDDFDTQIQPEELPHDEHDYSSLEDAHSHLNDIVKSKQKDDSGVDEMFENKCNECGSSLIHENECMECGYKPMNESHLCAKCGGQLNEEGICNECNGGMYESKKKTLRLTQSELQEMIKNIVAESVPGLQMYTKVHNADKEENDEYLSSVDKKMKDYLSFKGNNETEFPQQDNEGEKVAYRNTDQEDKDVDDYRGGGMQDLEYDEPPSAQFVDRLRKALTGDRTMGNAPETEKVDGELSNGGKMGEESKHKIGTSVKTETGEKMFKEIDRKHKEKHEAPMYKKDPAPVKSATIKPLEQKINEAKEETKENKVVLEEIKRMKEMLSYNKKTQ